MAEIQGIIFSDIFVAHKDDFIRYFAQHFKANEAQIRTAIRNLDAAIPNSGNLGSIEQANKFNQAWINFENIVLNNTQDLQLIVGYRDPTSNTRGDVQLSTIIPQKDATIGKYIDAGSEAVRTAMRLAQQRETAKRAEAALRNHLDGFLKTLYQHHLNRDDIRYMINEDPSPIPDRWWNAKNADGHALKLSELLTGKNWQDIFYEQYYSGQGLGKAYDAYMNHVANHHRMFYDYLSSSGAGSQVANIPTLANSVYDEEGGIRGNFPYLLNESLNTTGWYTGGDIVIVDPETMTVVYNIQLKTTRDTHTGTFSKGENKGKTYIVPPKKFEIAVGQLRLLIRGGYDSFKQKTHIGLITMDSAEAIAEALYDELLTSISNKNDFNVALQGTMDSIIEPIRAKTEKAMRIKLNSN